MKNDGKARSAADILRRWALASLLVVAAAIAGLGSGGAMAAAPAGAVIGNQATATYVDALGTTRTATSNLVQTTVAQVKSFALTASGARTAAPGQTVYYPHTLQNTGNGTDTYALVAPVSGNFTPPGAPHGSLAYYIDADGNGVPDNNTPITTTGPIAAGQFFRFVVAGTVPAGATFGNSATITVSATDTNLPTANTGTNTDTTTVQDSAITVTKALSVTSGPSPSAASIVVTLSYTNSGNAAATNVQITDTLPAVAGASMSYVAGSGRWSVTGLAFPGGNPLTDNVADGVEYAATFPPGIDYRASGGVVTAIIPSVGAGQSGSVQFRVDIPTGQKPGAITNTANYQTATQPSQTTNGATYQVLQSAGVAFNGAANNSGIAQNDPNTIASAAAGSTFTFTNYVWNKGNATDTFDITTVSNNFPAGSSVQLLQQDGTSTLLNSGGAAAPDTGPVPAPGAACNLPFVSDGTYCAYKMVVKVTLPANAPNAAYSVVLRATSVFDNTVVDDMTDTLSAVAPNTVDVTNNVPAGPGAPGLGAGTTTVIQTNGVTPTSGSATTTRFMVYVTNTGAVSDSFNLTAVLAASSTGSVVPPTLPAGWSVAFRADGGGGTCATVGATLTSTGAIAAAGNRLVCAEVTVPATSSGTAFAGDFDFDFTARSATNPLVLDVIRDRVTVSTVRSITLTPNNAQQTLPSGSVTYQHTLTNSGNAADTVSFAALCLVDTRSGQGWTSTAYIDANANGTLEVGTDTLVTCGATTLNLAIGESRTIFVRAFSPGSATSADPANVTTITVTYGAATASATDTTTVTDGLQLLKEQQALGTAGCTNNNPAAASYSQNPIAAGANTVPGSCIAYRITATNLSAGTITSVTVSDIVPPNTKMRYSCSGNGASTPTVTAGGAIQGTTPADNNVGTVSALVPSLTSAAAARLYFCVMIDP